LEYDGMPVSARIRWQVFALRQEREVRCTQDGGAILVRLHETGEWVPLEDMRGIDSIPVEERYKVILGAASAGDKKPKLEELSVTPFRLEGKIEVRFETHWWIDDDGTEMRMGTDQDVMSVLLVGGPIIPIVLSARKAARSRWRRVIASVEGDSFVFGRGPTAPLHVTVVCPNLATRRVRVVVETAGGLIVAGFNVDRVEKDKKHSVVEGTRSPRPLIVTMDAAGKPRVFYVPK
jgi:hypothetical protein